MHTSAETRNGQSMDEGVRHIKSDMRKTGQKLKEDLEHGQEELKNVAREAGEHMREFVDSAGDEISEVTHSLTDKIRNKPVEATLIALGVGFLTGVIFFRRY